jgi:hypothetical protein
MSTNEPLVIYPRVPYYLGDFHANLSARLGNVEVKPTTDISGMKCSELLNCCSPVGYVLKMLLDSPLYQKIPSAWIIRRKMRFTLKKYYPRSWKISKKQDIVFREQPQEKQSFLLFRLAPLGAVTEEIGCSSLLPTIRKHETGDYQYSQGNHDKKTQTLSGAIKTIPTLTKSDATMGDLKGREFVGTRHALKLGQIIPTCTGRDHKGGTIDRVNAGNPRFALDCEMQTIGLKLQPAFAEWMMGFPIGYTELSASEMPSSRSKSTRSSKQSQTLKEV